MDTSVRQLMASNGAALNVIDAAKKAKKGDKYLNSGTLHATYCYIEENPTFSDVSAWNKDGLLCAAYMSLYMHGVIYTCDDFLRWINLKYYFTYFLSHVFYALFICSS